MSDIERLRGWFDEGRLVPVRLDAPGTVHLGRALAHQCGVDGIDIDPPARQIAETIGEAQHCLFVLVDGLGMNLVETLPANSFLRTHMAMELRSVHPSGTPSGLTSLATGQWPGEHGVVGWFEYLETRDVSVIALPFVERFSHEPLGEFSVADTELFGMPSLMAHMERDVASFVPDEINDSVYSRYFGGHRPGQGYASLTEAVQAVADRIRRATRPTYTYVYVPFVDQAEHAHGVFSDEALRALAHVDAALGTLAESVPLGVRIVVSADHGQIDVLDADTCMLPDDDPLLGLLRAAPSGDPRVPLFHVRQGRQAEFEAMFRDRFGERFALLTTDELASLQLVGPTISKAARSLLGDYTAIPRAASVLRHRPESPMRGYHGGMTAAECRIPLIVA
jgi:predicted AlkP superfamily pyrophosphatase or phosphodiesterase